MVEIRQVNRALAGRERRAVHALAEAPRGSIQRYEAVPLRCSTVGASEAVPRQSCRVGEAACEDRYLQGAAKSDRPLL
ncbi:unannotated protein [freshwater metagenome]|uniref:Unannotated protein n=1 Tax=freshwater metagenome TaxID=449393 RepID=A0A6J7HZQ5_9ZZZZ